MIVAVGVKKEVTMKLRSKIGEYTYELEAEQGSGSIEISVWDESRKLFLLTNLDQFELDGLSSFFLAASQEVERLNDQS